MTLHKIEMMLTYGTGHQSTNKKTCLRVKIVHKAIAIIV